ncbi:anion transporter [Campylobacter jejuni 255]|nr:anion transporter [Campylobacter jejuni 255]KDA23049.1 anion transporter [Campylobacter jejuni 10227]KDA29317.1 anion transporter [Campylobacter jejuni Cj1]
MAYSDFYFVARGVIKTGLGEHLAYHFISILGKKT